MATLAGTTWPASSSASEPASDDAVSESEPDARQLRRELELERYRNSQLTAQLKRQTKLNEQLVTLPPPPASVPVRFPSSALPRSAKQRPPCCAEQCPPPVRNTTALLCLPPLCSLHGRVRVFPLQQQSAEQEEEYITIKLMKRLTALKHEKEHLARQVEMEEEMISNKLSKKLEAVKQEKINLENLLEQEQEYIVNKLQKQLSAVLDEKRALETQLRDSTGTILQTLQQHLERWRGCETGDSEGVSRQPPPPPWTEAPPDIESELAQGEIERTHLLVKHLATEIDALGEQQERYRTECEEHRKRNDTLRQELSRLEADNSGLQHRIVREREIREAAQEDRARLETELELDSERQFNSLSSSREASPALTSSVPPLVLSPKGGGHRAVMISGLSIGQPSVFHSKRSSKDLGSSLSSLSSDVSYGGLGSPVLQSASQGTARVPTPPAQSRASSLFRPPSF